MSDKIQMLPVADTAQITATGQEIIKQVAEAMGISYEMLCADHVPVEVAWSREVMKVYMEDARRRAILPLLDPRV